MARFDLFEADHAVLGAVAPTGDVFFQLGLAYATGRTVQPDRVTAHKWFNIAALKGNAEAVRLRRELAAEMSETEIAAAQRAAREWLGAH